MCNFTEKIINMENYTYEKFVEEYNKKEIDFKIIDYRYDKLIYGSEKIIHKILYFLHNINILIIPLTAYYMNNWWILMGYFIIVMATGFSYEQNYYKKVPIIHFFLIFCIIYWIKYGFSFTQIITIFYAIAIYTHFTAVLDRNLQKKWAKQNVLYVEELFNKLKIGNNIEIIKNEVFVFNEKQRDKNNFVEEGMQFLIKGQTNSALECFDNAIESGCLEEVFDLRAGCLQALGYHYEAIEDFDKAIMLSPEDCNMYFSRSISKGAILDYLGEINDLEIAIKLSKIDNKLNRGYNEEAISQGYENGIAELYDLRLELVLGIVKNDLKQKDKVRNASNTKEKEFWQQSIDEYKEKKLSLVKRRNRR